MAQLLTADLRHPLGNQSEAPSPREQACLGVILRTPAFPLTSTYNPPLLSHQLNLNKSSPSWPHPPASAFLPRGPEAPTTQAVWGGGAGVAAWLPEGGLPRGEHMHTVQMLPTRSLTRSSAAHTCVAIRVCAQPSGRHEPCACPHKTHVHTAPSVPSTRAHSTDRCLGALPRVHQRCTHV